CRPPRRLIVPEGQLRIAQRFNVGNRDPRPLVPKGRLNGGERVNKLSRPFGTRRSISARVPNVETLGYCRLSLRDKPLNSLPKGFGLAVSFVALWLCVSCRPPGKPTAADIELRPEEVRDFATLYQ